MNDPMNPSSGGLIKGTPAPDAQPKAPSKIGKTLQRAKAAEEQDIQDQFDKQFPMNDLDMKMRPSTQYVGAFLDSMSDTTNELDDLIGKAKEHIEEINAQMLTLHKDRKEVIDNLTEYEQLRSIIQQQRDAIQLT